MALTSTLFTGLSGLDVNQTRLNVVGNNIANVNTVAFKSSRAIAKPQFYVTDNAGSPSSDDFGGTNPSQRGLGASVASIDKNFTTGSLETTGRATDLAIDGDGFFVVKGTEQMYTRDGTFKLNDQNQLVTTGGDFVQGFGADANGNVIAGTVDKITIPLGTQTSATATQNVTLEGNLNANGDVSSGASILLSEQMVPVTGAALPADPTTLALTDLASPAASGTSLFAVGDVLSLDGTRGGRNTGASTLTVTAGTTLGDLSSFFQQGMGIDTTIPDDGNPATPEPGVTIDTTGGFITLAVAGNRGKDNAITIPSAAFTNDGGTSPFTFHDKTKDEGSPWSDPTGETVFTSFNAYDSLGTSLNINVTMALDSKSNTGNTWRYYATSPQNTDVATLNGTGSIVGTGTLTFDNKGKLLSSTGTQIQIHRDNTGATSPLNVNLDFDSLTSLTSSKSDLVMTKQDGSAIGSLNSFSIADNGTITGSFTNGLTRNLGKVALATFKNPQGLIDHGGNMYSTGTSSGVAILSSPQQLGAGAIRSGTLEMSNVDLSTEFTNMIIASTGFSAASRVISTANQLIQELLNTAR